MTGSVKTVWKSARTAPASRPATTIALRTVLSERDSSKLVAGEPGGVTRVVDELVKQVELVRSLAEPWRQELALVQPEGEQAKHREQPEPGQRPEGGSSG